MERRKFLQLIGVATLAPTRLALPAANMGTVTPTAVQYAWAARYARVHNAASPARFVAALKVSPQVAQALAARVTANGLFYASLTPGASQVAKPMPKAARVRVPRHSKRTTSQHGWDQLTKASDTPPNLYKDPTAMAEKSPKEPLTPVR